MKLLRPTVFGLGSMMLAACTSVSQTPNPSSTASLDKPDSIQPQMFMLRGDVTIGAQTQTLTPCGSQQQFELQIPANLKTDAEQVAIAPYEPMYAEVLGYLIPPSQTGYNGDYAGKFVVTQINTLNGKEKDRCHLYPLPTRAFGTEPTSWSAQFADKGVVFAPAVGTQQTLPIDGGQLSGQQRTYQLKGGSVQLKAASCINKTASALYGWQAQLTIGEQQYQGCAVLGNTDTSLNWSGIYYASSTTNSGFSVSMQLGQDHTAITRYSYTNGDPDVVEKGYWQPLNSDQIQVVMTRHQQQYLVTERIFTRSGEQLKATQEKVGTTVYPIASGGLVLFKDFHESAKQNSAKPTNGDQFNSTDEYDENVDQAVRGYLAQHHQPYEGSHYRWLTYDLNGDDNPELLVQMDWCHQADCTLLIFKNEQHQWQFNSRLKSATPLYLDTLSTNGWHDLIIAKQNLASADKLHRLHYVDGHYSELGEKMNQLSTQHATVLFADGISPQQQGIAL